MKKSLVLGLGSNLGNRYYYIYLATQLLKKTFNSDVIVSNIYETAPWGNTNQSSFLNTAAVLSTSLDSKTCFKTIKEIEQHIGRKKGERWGPRSIDIDILFLEDEVSNQNDVEIPHPRIAERSFVLIPCADIVPQFVHPKLHETLLELSSKVDNDCELFVKQIKP
ncbi:MAG: 2-amino-4-hydroxy-6-hydroxymethyldihydropteridine diphosphokinase [Bacteroidia bacterium]|nr:2-amino-4-hydroxy-6-hydroxymethyldihydropteridine diphosphokinase [Bacteroidia bacterium]NNJ55147.1 2-amino-4-hydroxy-6-hydroxymethyldihydropteridine diphosphokinase [Bacteroidia bacterium]